MVAPRPISEREYFHQFKISDLSHLDTQFYIRAACVAFKVRGDGILTGPLGVT